MLEALRDLPNLPVFNAVVKNTVKLAETSLEGVPILKYASRSDASQAYRDLAVEVVEKVKGRGGAR
jgi:cellulose biosynthesis protein BcsQ